MTTCIGYESYQHIRPQVCYTHSSVGLDSNNVMVTPNKCLKQFIEEHNQMKLQLIFLSSFVGGLAIGFVAYEYYTEK